MNAAVLVFLADAVENGGMSPAITRVLVSACLLGEAVRHDGRHKRVDGDVMQRWRESGRIVGFCPECAGGLPVPRPASEIEPGASTESVLAGTARVRTRAGDDVTDAFRRGAEAALALANAEGIRVAVLKESSPSCGSTQIHDGRFVGQTRPGVGVTTARLRAAGIRVFSELELEAADAVLQMLDRETGCAGSLAPP